MAGDDRGRRMRLVPLPNRYRHGGAGGGLVGGRPIAEGGNPSRRRGRAGWCPGRRACVQSVGLGHRTLAAAGGHARRCAGPALAAHRAPAGHNSPRQPGAGVPLPGHPSLGADHKGVVESGRYFVWLVPVPGRRGDGQPRCQPGLAHQPRQLGPPLVPALHRRDGSGGGGGTGGPKAARSRPGGHHEHRHIGGGMVDLARLRTAFSLPDPVDGGFGHPGVDRGVAGDGTGDRVAVRRRRTADPWSRAV